MPGGWACRGFGQPLDPSRYLVARSWRVDNSEESLPPCATDAQALHRPLLRCPLVVGATSMRWRRRDLLRLRRPARCLARAPPLSPRVPQVMIRVDRRAVELGRGLEFLRSEVLNHSDQGLLTLLKRHMAVPPRCESAAFGIWAPHTGRRS